MKRTLIVVAICTLSLAVGGWGLLRDDSGSSDLVAIFDDAGSLEVGNDVRIDGVRVGEISAIELRGGAARVQMTLAEEALPLHEDARVTVKPINILGENYVAVDPGSSASPILRGAEVPRSRTDSTVDLQDVVDTFDDPTSTALAALVTTLGEGVRGGGQNVADAVKALAPTMADLDGLGQVLTSQNAVLSRLVEQADPVAAAVAGTDGQELDALVANARLTLEALGDNQAAIEETVAELPATVAEARRTLAGLRQVSGAVTPVLDRARPVTRDLAHISGEIVDFSRHADPALRAFGPLMSQADRLLKRLAPSARALRGAGGNLRTTAALARPTADILLDRSMGDLMSFVTKWALSTNGRDGASHYFRGVAHVTPATLRAMLGVQTPAPKTTTQGPLGKPNDLIGGLEQTINGLGQLLGSTTDALAPALGTVDSLVGGLLGTKPRMSTSATGLTGTQEQELLRQLLGGGDR